MACAQNPNTYLGARYRRIATRRGPQKANVAIQRSMLTAIWHMGHYRRPLRRPRRRLLQPGPPRTSQNRGLHQLQDMGYKVTLDRVG